MSRHRPRVVAIVPAAGSGVRMGGSVRKQFLLLKGKPILIHTLQQFEHCPEVDEIHVAVPESAIAEMESLASRYRLHKVAKIVMGGARRQDSVANAIAKIVVRDADILIVHDGVRPFVETKRIALAVRMAKEHHAAVLAVQPKDTIRRSTGGGFFDQTLDRNALWLIQTPQAFRADVLLKAFARAKRDRFSATDEAALVERIGIKAKIVDGTYDNIKITTQEDLDLAGLILHRWQAGGLM